MMRSLLWKVQSAALLLLLRFVTISAHPGAIASGRASCGTEYSTAENAYIIPDIREAWYLRRISTCESPVFWTKFEVTSQNQPIYIAVISPEIERFQDQLQFHGILYGPGIHYGGGVMSSNSGGNTSHVVEAAAADATAAAAAKDDDDEDGFTDIPDSLPKAIMVDQDLAMAGAGYMTSPTNFGTCAFVDTNPVMQRFSDLHEGRCMEEFTVDETFEDTLQQSTTSWSWWLYSFNHKAVEPGTYYLQTWLTSREDPTSVVQGKYEMTLGPWTWSGYASDATLGEAQEQGTSCSCAVNALDYKEHYLERLGGLDSSFEVAQLSGGSCTTAASSPCGTIPQEPYMSEGSAVEWSGIFDLEAGRTYEWTFHSYYQGANESLYGYPDPGMYVHIVPASNISLVADEGNGALTNAVDAQGDAPELVVPEGDSVWFSLPQFIEFTETDVANSTTVLIIPEANATSLAFFTQHVPSEFMAHVLRDQESGEYIFPTQVTLYVNAPLKEDTNETAVADEGTLDMEELTAEITRNGEPTAETTAQTSSTEAEENKLPVSGSCPFARASLVLAGVMTSAALLL